MKKQAKSLHIDVGSGEPIFLFALYDETSGKIAIQGCCLKPIEAANAADALKTMAESCNVATPKLISPKSSLFDSCKEPQVYTVEIDNKILTDFQTLRNSPNEDIRKTLLGLMDYYSNYDQLNIILLHDVLAKRQSYTKFTAQLANYLANSQRNYNQVKVQFNHLTTQLGIFCRLGSPGSTLNSSFLGSVTATLLYYKSAEVLTAEIPMSYLGNRSALKHQLTKRLGKKPQIHWTKTSVKIFI